MDEQNLILINYFIPILKSANYTDDEIKMQTVTNPKNAFTIRKRLL